MKAPALKTLTENAPGGQFVPELKPLPGEYIVRKTQASAFFGTNFGAWLFRRPGVEPKRARLRTRAGRVIAICWPR